MSSPAIVHKAKFVKGSSKTFSSYIDYIDRDEATRNYTFQDFSLFNDYMGNPEKSGSLFTADKDLLNDKDKENLKEKFKLAQKNGSLMWQDVFSFDNDWLVENGYYDDETHILDEERLRAAVRRAMNNQIERDNMNSAVWSASFHYNTKHIHVHIATVELTDKPRERGKRTKSSIGKMKSDFINELRDRQKEYQKINEIIRENIINSRENFLSADDKILREKTIELLKKLPTNRRYWYYDYNKINHIKPLLNSISKYYIQNYHKEDYKELMKRLTIEEIEFKRVYGEGREGKEKGRYGDYKKNKLDDLYKRMGNSILKELREHVNEEQNRYKNKNKNYKSRESDFKDKERINPNEFKNNNENSYKSSKEDFRTYGRIYSENNFENDFFKNIRDEVKQNSKTYYKFNISINPGTINKMKKAMNNTLEKYLNKREYEKAERNKDYERDKEQENELEI